MPLIYVQQFWRTLEFHPDESNHHFTACVDHFDTSFGVSMLRRLLGFPARYVRLDKAEFDNFHTESEIIQGVRELGYTLV